MTVEEGREGGREREEEKGKRVTTYFEWFRSFRISWYRFRIAFKHYSVSLSNRGSARVLLKES